MCEAPTVESIRKAIADEENLRESEIFRLETAISDTKRQSNLKVQLFREMLYNTCSHDWDYHMDPGVDTMHGCIDDSHYKKCKICDIRRWISRAEYYNAVR